MDRGYPVLIPSGLRVITIFSAYSAGSAVSSYGSIMSADEQAIRSLIETWLAATAAGDVPKVLELMDDDVVFIGPGRPPMCGKETFAAASRAMDGKAQWNGSADIKEIRVFGDWAYCWNHLTMTLSSGEGAPPMRMSGPALSVLRKNADGRWLMFRDANMVTPISK